jgi:electron transfer flavoprotein alpha subunit
MILVYSDNRNLTLEMLSKGRELAREKDVTAVVIGQDNKLEEYIKRGADKVILAETELNFKVEEYTCILEEIFREIGSEIIMIGSNKNGRELAPRLAAKLDTGCITDCMDIYFKKDKLVTERIVYSGNAMATQEFTAKPCIITIPPKLFEPLPPREREGKIVRKKIDFGRAPSKIIKVEEMVSEGINIEDAEIIVSCGRGFKKKEDIRLVEDLAQALKGNAIGCSRPIAADLKWLSEDHWVGLSGHKVKPKLYIAAGISGQIQHIAGMRDSRIIVAINKDPEALIFKSADYGIVGDLYEVLPKLTEAIKQRRG